MWKPEQLLEGKGFDPVFAHAIVRKYPELDDILWDACYLERDEEYYTFSMPMYWHKLRLSYRGEDVALLSAENTAKESFYNFIMDS